MKKLSHEEFLKVLKRTDVSVIGVYTGRREHIDVKCSLCGNIWSPVACNLINGSGCPECGNKNRKNSQIWSNETFLKHLSETNQNIHPLEEYKGYNTKILFRCDICNNQWEMKPHDIFRSVSCGCPKCSQQKRINTCNKLFGGNTPFASQEVRDKAAKSLEQNDSQKPKSIGENIIKQWLDDNNETYQREAIFEDCRDKRPLPFDFKILNEDGSIKCLIEYDGEQHTRGWDGQDESLEIIQKHDNMKTKYCENNNLKLIRISHLQNPIKILNRELKEHGI